MQVKLLTQPSPKQNKGQYFSYPKLKTSTITKRLKLLYDIWILSLEAELGCSVTLGVTLPKADWAICFESFLQAHLNKGPSWRWFLHCKHRLWCCWLEME